MCKENNPAAPQPQESEDWFSPLAGEMVGIMDCVVYGLEHSIDILSCDESQFTITPHVQKSAPPVVIDFAQRHDEFLESLLQEQESLRNNEGGPASRPVLMSSSSSTLEESSERSEAPKQQQSSKRRPLKLSRRSPAKQKSPMRSHRKVAPLLESDEQSSVTLNPLDPPDDASLISRLTVSSLPHPASYIHTQCRLQKDKGKGEPIGSDVCAIGRGPCLEKLRQKMELLTQVAMGGKNEKKKKSKSASMKRRKAKVVEQNSLITETRSVIDLKMGFLSMQYGVLLQWDRVGNVTMCVLRKMCHESFFQKAAVKPANKRVIQRESPPIVLRTDSSNHVILQRWDGTEVTLLEPPYRVDRPISFEPSVMSMTIVKLDGFDQKSTWTVRLGLDGLYHKARCQSQDAIIRPILDRPMEWQLNSDLDLSLDYAIYEQKRPRQKRKKLISKDSISLNLLDGSRVAQSRLVVLPVKDFGSIHVNIVLQSDYCHWLYQELDARRREENWRAPFYPVYIEEPSARKEQDDFLWRLCCV